MWFWWLHAARGVAACAVVLLHAYWTWPLAFAAPVRNLHLAVDLFFVLSGYVLCAAFGGTFTRARDIGPFMLRRLGRLLPTLLASGAAWVAASVLFPASRPEPVALADAVLRYVSLTDVFFAHPTWRVNPVAWSVMAEVWVYLVFALLFTLVQNRPLRLLLCMGVSAASLAHVLGAHADLDVVAGGGALVRALGGFFLGSAMSLACAADGEARRVARSRMLALALALAALALLALQQRYAGIYAALASLVPLAASLPVPRGRGLGVRALTMLGDASYSLYMWHFLVAVTTAKLLSRLAGQGVMEFEGERFVLANPVLGTVALLAYVLVAHGIAVAASRSIERWRPFMQARAPKQATAHVGAREAQR